MFFLSWCYFCFCYFFLLTAFEGVWIHVLIAHVFFCVCVIRTKKSFWVAFWLSVSAWRGWLEAACLQVLVNVWMSGRPLWCACSGVCPPSAVLAARAQHLGLGFTVGWGEATSFECTQLRARIWGLSLQWRTGFQLWFVSSPAQLYVLARGWITHATRYRLYLSQGQMSYFNVAAEKEKKKMLRLALDSWAETCRSTQSLLPLSGKQLKNA